MTRAVLSLGSNLGDRLAHLQAAVDGLGPAVRAVSPVYETAPWGPVAQDDYLNAIVLVDDDLVDDDRAADDRAADDEAGRGAMVGDAVADSVGSGGEVWLRRAQLLEQGAGRMRTVRYGSRTLDVDVVTVDGVRSDDPRLTLPHPRAHERAFVLVPWLAVSAGAVLPGHGTVAELVAGLAPEEISGVRRRADLTLSLPPRSASPVAALNDSPGWRSP